MMSLRLGRRGRSLSLLRFLFLATLFGAGLWVRGLSPVKATAGKAGPWPWQKSKMVTLYFSDGRFLVPVSRRMPGNADVPRAVLQGLLDGPTAASGLTNPVPRGVKIRSFQLAGGGAQIDLSGAIRDRGGDVNSAET